MQAEVVLFSRPEFFALHTDAGRGDVWFDRNSLQVGFLQIEKGVYVHPGRGSYGHLWRDDHDTREAIDRITETLREQYDFLHARIDLPPTLLFGDEMCTIMEHFRKQGWSICTAEATYLIPVEQDFDTLVDYGNRKRIQQTIQSGAEFELYGGEDFSAYYEVIYTNRVSKGYTLAMDYEAIQKMHSTFRDYSFWCGLRGREGTVIAAAWVLKPLPHVWQIVYWGHHPDAEQYSPVSYLASQIYAGAKSAGIHWLDLGTAHIHGKPNKGLIRYKLNLGAVPTLKFSLMLNKP